MNNENALKKTKLELFPYCDGCDQITPKVEKLETINVLDEETYVSITCKNAPKCENMRKHILSMIQGNE